MGNLDWMFVTLDFLSVGFRMRRPNGLSPVVFNILVPI